jgi:exosortase/archaeosortase family protein
MASPGPRAGKQTGEELADTSPGVGEVVSKGAARVDPRLLRVGLVFVITFAILNGLLLFVWNTRAFYGVRTATALIANGLINASGVPATRLGTRIYLSSRVLEIDGDCTALLVLAVYGSLVVAYPVLLRTKAVGLLVGLPALLVLNQVRLVAVAHASELLSGGAFSFVHDYLFKVFMIAGVVGLWAWWLAYARRRARA